MVNNSGYRKYPQKGRLTKVEEADNSTRKLPTRPQRLAGVYRISRSALKIF